MSNVYDFMEEYDRAAQARALDAMDGSPDEAAEAVNISKATGHPAPAVDDEFKNNLKGALATNFVRNNPHIADYVNSHPMAANVSADDFGQLDKISDLLMRSNAPVLAPLGAQLKAMPQTYDIAKAGLENLGQVFGEAAGLKEPSEEDKAQQEKVKEWMIQHGATAERAEVEARLLQGRTLRGNLIQAPAALAQIALAPILGPIRKFLSEPLSQATGIPTEVIEGYAMVAGAALGLKFEMGAADRAAINRRLNDIRKLSSDAEPWVRTNQDPPPGVNEIIDDLKLKQGDIDKKQHQELAGEVNKSTTQARLPDFMENYIGLRSKQVVSIPHDALYRLYGDKEPIPGDGLIGDVSGADVGYRFARSSGGDIDIPLSEWLAKVPKEVKQELWDDVRFRPGGITKNEAEVLKEWHKLQEEPEPPKEGEAKSFEVVDKVTGEVVDSGLTQADAFRTTAGSNQYLIREGQGPVVKLEDTVGAAPTLADKRPLPIASARRQAGIPAGWDLGTTAPLFDVGAPKDVVFPGGKARTILSTTVGEATAQIDYGQGVLGSLAAKIMSLAKDIEVHVLPRDKMAAARATPGEPPLGFYSPDLHHITLSEDTWRAIQRGKRTLLHEAVHAVTSRALLVKGGEEIRLTMKLLLQENPELAKHYGFFHGDLDAPNAIHEFLAEAVANPLFQNELARTPLTEGLGKALGVGDWAKKSVWRGFVEFVHRLLGLSEEHFSALDAALKLTEDYIGVQGRLTPKELHRFDYWAEKFKEQPMTLAQEREPFETPGAIGTTATGYKLFQRNIAKQREAELKAQEQKAAEIAKKQASADWKANRKVERNGALEALTNHPVPQAAEFLRDGMYNGQKLRAKPKLDIAKLTSEQKKALPRDFYGRGGYAPDDIASMFGFDSGDRMIEQVAAYEKARGKMRPDNYLNKLIEQETDRRMQQKYGSILEQTIKEAQEHIVGDTQMSLIHQETLMLAEKAGIAPGSTEFPLSKEQMRNGVAQEFGEQRHLYVDREKFLNESGKAGRNVELSFLKGDFKAAFRFHQQQYWALLRAKEAMKFEKEKERFETLVNKYAKRDVPNRSGEFTPWIQQLLINHGHEVKRQSQDHAAALDHSGFNSLESIITQKKIDGFDIYAEPGLYTPGDPMFNKPTEKMTVNEWRMLRDAVTSLDKSSLNMRQAQGLFEAMNFDKAKDIAITIIKARREGRAPPTDEPHTIVGKIRKTGKTIGVMHLTMETKLNWLDKDNPRGFFHKQFIMPMAEAANGESRMMKIVDRQLKEAAGRIPDIDKRVENSLWKEPGEGLNQFMSFSKHNVLGILQHAGNPENLAKLAAGYDLTPDQVMNWLFSKTTKEDWDRAQRIGNVFKPVFDEADRRAYQRSGVSIKRVELQPIVTPFGTYEGWYNPIEHDKFRPGTSGKASPGPKIDDLFQAGSIYRPSPSHGYAMARTGYIAPMDLTLNAIPKRLTQMIHDIHFRDPIMNIAKFAYDKDFVTAMNHHLGPEWTDQLKSWLHDVANYAHYSSGAAYDLSKTSEYFRQNTIHSLIGFNWHTVSKHGLTAAFNSITEVGPINFLKATATIFNATHDVSRANWQFAFEKSEELQRRMKNWSDMAEHKPEVALLKQGGIRTFIQHLGSTPVALGDMASSVPTWLAQYEKSMKDGVTPGQAIAEADRSVRRAHGSSVVTNRSQIMRGNALAAWYSSLYGFFSHMIQKQFEMAWKAKATGQAAKAGDFREAWKYGKQLPGMFMSFIIWPAIVEEMITPYTNSEKESWGLKAAKVMELGLSSSWVGMRDAIHSFVNVRNPEFGLMGPALQAPAQLIRDVPKIFSGTPEQKGRIIRNANGLLGVLAGVSSLPIGRAEEFLYRYNHGLEHPKGFGWLHASGLHELAGVAGINAPSLKGEPGWITGLTKGTMRKEK